MKPLTIYATRGVAEELEDQIPTLRRLLASLFTRHPLDMFVIEPNSDDTIKIRAAGYSFETNELDEETVLYEGKPALDRVVWFKIDDYGRFYVGTFLFPDEY